MCIEIEIEIEKEKYGGQNQGEFLFKIDSNFLTLLRYWTTELLATKLLSYWATLLLSLLATELLSYTDH